MNKKVKIGAISALSLIFMVSAGAIISGRNSNDKIKKETNNNSKSSQSSASDIEFTVDSYENEKKENTEELDANSDSVTNAINQSESENTEGNDIASNDTVQNSTSDSAKSKSSAGTANAYTNTDTNSVASASTNPYAEEAKNSLDDVTRQNLIKNVEENESNYINAKEIENSCEYNFEVLGVYSADSDATNAMSSAFGIEKETYYDVVGFRSNKPIEYQMTDDTINYLVGATSGKIIIMPDQGGKEAYEVKNNTIVKVYSDNDGSYIKWR